MRLVVNGRPYRLGVPRHAPLLNVLRNDLALNGPKYGCGLGECGACAVLVDGIEARACVIPVGGVEGREVTTLEGLAARVAPRGEVDGLGEISIGAEAGSGAWGGADAGGRAVRSALHPVQQAFIDAEAAQCGYCLNGMIVATVALLERVADPDPGQIRAALAANLCRCGTHLEILAAVRLAAARLREANRRLSAAAASARPAGPPA